jgi:hypothetical protein
MYPYVAPHTSKIHTLITLGISPNPPLSLREADGVMPRDSSSGPVRGSFLFPMASGSGSGR